MLASAPLITSEQVDQFHRDGFCALPAITTAQEVGWLREIYDRLFDQRAGRADGNQFDLAGADEEGEEAALPQILMPSRYAPELKDGLFRRNALAIAHALLGAEAIAQGEHAILKPARGGPATPWHQDEAYWGEQVDYNAISIWIPLQDATVENGCMHFVPGSNKLDVLPHHSIGHDRRVHGLEVDDGAAEFSRAVACPIPAGGCTVHHCRTLHYAGPNRSSEARRAYILAFGTPPMPRPTPRVFHWNRIKETAREARAQRSAGRPA
jgi:ectoine hydroxylase-related dioxygenase (phytanoyl-CoA dioxygenase family)